MSFENAYENTIGHEGGYANDPHDRGAETYAGISRKYHPDWSGWRIIDGHKGRHSSMNGHFIVALKKDKHLNLSVKQFYEYYYWKKPGFDGIDVINSNIAEKLFDIGVNIGTRTASKWFQRTLNILNRDQRVYDDIKVDGMIGNKSIRTFEKCVKHTSEKIILNVLNSMQGNHYISIMERDGTQEKWIGWFNRLGY